MSTYCSSLFNDIQVPEKKYHWGSFAAGYIVQAIAVTALLVFTVSAPRFDSIPVRHVDLVAPELDATPKASQIKRPPRVAGNEPAPVTMPVISKMQTPVLPPALQVEQPQRVHRVTEVAEIPQPQLTMPAAKFDSRVLNKAASKIVAINTFGESSATPTLHKLAPSEVQTGGFGDPNGIPTGAHGGSRPNIAAVGSFDLPIGAGHGNGTGGASGARGTIASVGFGNNSAAQPGSHNRRDIHSTNFATALVAPAGSPKIVSHQTISAPVSIQSKPTPVYTLEARQLRVEGEVLLSVVFTAEGQIRILNVVRGLGHGLDEAAQRAAQGVRFSPATRNGRAVDSNATLHIIFQLS